jgi:hypothetical protein
MFSSSPVVRRASALAEMVRWRVRGLVETDRVRRVKFGLRELWQRGEIAARREWAHELAAEEPMPLDRAVGYRVKPFEVDLSGVVRLGARLAADLQSASQAHGKSFHVNKLLPDEPTAVATMLALATHEPLLRLVSTYLGVVPVLGDLDFFATLPTPEGTPYTSSQLYHCDEESLTQLKLFVYCGDVAPQDGPLEVVGAQQSQMVRDRLHYRFGGRAYRVGDTAMTELVPASDQHAIVGPAATSLLLDTSRCFHRGSRIRDGERRRCVAVIQFAPPSSTHLPRRLHDGTRYKHLVTPAMTPLARAVLGEPIAG